MSHPHSSHRGQHGESPQANPGPDPDDESRSEKREARREDRPHIELATYTPPTITASGTTFAQFQAGGASGHLERLIAAQSPALSAAVVSMVRSAEKTRLQDPYRKLASEISQFNAGEPSAVATVKANLLNINTAFSLLATLCAEMGVLIDANPGTLGSVATPIGGRRPIRTWP